TRRGEGEHIILGRLLDTLGADGQIVVQEYLPGALRDVDQLLAREFPERLARPPHFMEVVFDHIRTGETDLRSRLLGAEPGYGLHVETLVDAALPENGNVGCGHGNFRL